MMRLTLAALLWAATSPWSLAVKETNADLRGVYAAGHGAIWASGANGTVLRSEDDGYMWQTCQPPAGAQKLDFRAVYAWDGYHAQVLSVGPGDASRLYETTDGCASWRLLFSNPDPAGFWDSLVYRGKTGLLLGDPVNGRFVIYRSDDGGQHWQREGSPGLTANGQGVFAASNSSLVVLPNGHVLFGTGGAGTPRVFRSDQPNKWTSVEVPIAGDNEAAGVFSLAFRDARHGIAVGGDYKHPEETSGTAAFTADGGVTWQAATKPPTGYRSAVAYDSQRKAWIAAGTNGSDLSYDDGRTWKRLDEGHWNALSLPWIAGPQGRLAVLDRASPLLR